VDPSLVERLAVDGELPAYRIGNEYRFDEAEVKNYLDANRIGGKLSLGRNRAAELRRGRRPRGMDTPVFSLILGSAYYGQGFFNVPKDADDYVPTDGEPVTLVLGPEEQIVHGYINRRANPNGTARVMGGTGLRNWIQANCEPGGTLNVDVSHGSRIGIRSIQQ